LAFHSSISQAVELHPHYKTQIIKGIDQPTSQSAVLRDGKIEPLRSYKGENKSGDGTVPRPSAHPPEWEDEDDGSSLFVSQSHAVLQSTDRVFTQIFGMVTGRQGKFMMAETGLGLDIPAIIEAGKAFPIEVTSSDGNSNLALHIICEDENGVAKCNPKLMKAFGAGRYRVSLGGLPEGAYRITARSATPARPVAPVSDWTLVLDANAA
jgi:hypothetical protein